MLHHLLLCLAAFHLPFNMLSYYIFCCPMLHYCILCYLTQHYIKLHYITLCCLISHLISLPLLYPPLDSTASLYPTLIYASLCSLRYNIFHILMISSVPLPCLALPHVPLHYTTFCSLDHCKHLLVNHFLFFVLSYATLHNISFTLFNIVFIMLQCFTLCFTQCYALLPGIALHNIKQSNLPYILLLCAALLSTTLLSCTFTSCYLALCYIQLSYVMLCYVMFVTSQSVTTYYPALHSLTL